MPMRSEGIDMDSQNAELQALVDEINAVSRADFLVNDYRKWIVERIRNEIFRFQRTKHPFALIQAEVANLDDIEAKYGKEARAEVLDKTGKKLLEAVREMDGISRWNGEQFLLLIIEIEPDDALYLGDRLRYIIEEGGCSYNGQEVETVVNAGVAIYTDEADTVQTLVAMVGDALTLAQDHGGNRVVILRKDEDDDPTDRLVATPIKSVQKTVASKI